MDRERERDKERKTRAPGLLSPWSTRLLILGLVVQVPPGVQRSLKNKIFRKERGREIGKKNLDLTLTPYLEISQTDHRRNVKHKTQNF